MTATQAVRRRLAIIGGGSSGLVTLKYALDELPDWDVICFERGARAVGVWGDPYPGFVSTSTKYTTQFACFPRFEAVLTTAADGPYAEFFRDGEYGQYLEDFAEHFGLLDHVALGQRVTSVKRCGERWRVERVGGDGRVVCERFNAVVLCAGREPIVDVDVGDVTTVRPDEVLKTDPAAVRNLRVVVYGGGESAVDVADRLADRSHGNEVYLSLRSGVRVSPRYHPVRGVPSDFLRNRLMLSFHPDVRNVLGRRFVDWRIAHEKIFRYLFPASATADGREYAGSVRRRDWDRRLSRAAGAVFDVYHTKNDGFLDAVGDGRIRIVGARADDSGGRFYEFGSTAVTTIDPDVAVPAVGYRSSVASLTAGAAEFEDFYLGCLHDRFDDLFVVGSARPVIGNVPTMSELQARLVCATLAERVARPTNIRSERIRDREEVAKRFPSLSQAHAYPVEMFAYCDAIAARLRLGPGETGRAGLTSRWRRALQPASTLHYSDPKAWLATPVFMPPSLVCLLLLLKPVDAFYRFWLWLCRRAVS